jgi:hypothetical protein
MENIFLYFFLVSLWKNFSGFNHFLMTVSKNPQKKQKDKKRSEMTMTKRAEK